MTRTINKNNVKTFKKAYNNYKSAFNNFNKLDKNTQKNLSDKLNHIESVSSVNIEEPRYAN